MPFLCNHKACFKIQSVLPQQFPFLLSERNRQWVQEFLQRRAVVFWMASHVGCMYRLLPLPALHRHAPRPPVVNALFHDHLVAQGIVFAGEEEGWWSDWAVVENQDAVVVEICCVGLEEPEIKHGGVFDKALKTWHQSPAKTWITTRDRGLIFN